MASYTVGLDLGKERDPSALVVAERVQRFEGLGHEQTFEKESPVLTDTYHVRGITRFELGTPYDAVVDSVSDLMSSSDLRDDAVLVFDRTGVGGAVADLFNAAYQQGRLGRCFWPLGITLTAGFSQHGGAQGYWSSTAHKQDVVRRLYLLLEQERVKIPVGLAGGEQLTKEIRAFRPKQNTQTGNLSFEAEHESDHDDLVIALALAVWYPHPHSTPRYIDTQTGELREQP